MMTPAILLAELEKRGAVVTVRENRIRCEAPAGALTDELRAAWTLHREAIAALLKSREAARVHIVDGEEIPRVVDAGASYLSGQLVPAGTSTNAPLTSASHPFAVPTIEEAAARLTQPLQAERMAA